MNEPSDPPASVPDQHLHPLTVDPESVDASRKVNYQIAPRIDGQAVAFELIVRRIEGSINLWADSQTEITWPRGLCEEHEALVFGPDGGGLRLGNQRVVALSLPTDLFERIQQDIRSLEPDGMVPADSRACLDAGSEHGETGVETETDDENWDRG